MIAHQTKLRLLACIMLVSSAGIANAQYFDPEDMPPDDFDYQAVFEPIGVYDGSRLRDSSEGYFFAAERMQNWFIRPTASSIGVNGNQRAFIPGSVSVTSVGGLVEQVNVGGEDANTSEPIGNVAVNGVIGNQVNSIRRANSNDNSGWGNRIEFGWVTDDTGWIIEIIDGIETSRENRYGFDDNRLDHQGGAQSLPGVDGSLGPLGNPRAGVLDPVDPTEGIPAILPIDGLNTVHVLFADPGMLLNGFVDLVTNGTVLPPSDGNPDDINPPAQAPPGFGPEDTIPIAVVFDDMLVRNVSELASISLMGIRRKRVLKRGIVAEAYFGGKFLELDDQFGVEARGGILADTSWQNRAQNRLIGPQFGLNFTTSAERWSVRLGSRFLAGANILAIRQQGVLASYLTSTNTIATPAVPAPPLENCVFDPGFPPIVADGVVIPGQSPQFICPPAPNPQPQQIQQFGRPIAMVGNEFFHQRDDIVFSPAGEVRLDFIYRLFHGVSVNAGWNGFVIDNVQRASNSVLYQIPQLGIQQNRDALFSTGFSLGILVNR